MSSNTFEQFSAEGLEMVGKYEEELLPVLSRMQDGISSFMERLEESDLRPEFQIAVAKLVIDRLTKSQSKIAELTK